MYATREIVQGATDQTWSPAELSRIDRAIAAGSEDIEGACHRHFYPITGSILLDWPDAQSQFGPSWTLWLGRNDVWSVSSVSSGGVALAAADYVLRGGFDRDGDPPYSRIEIADSSEASWNSTSYGPHQSIDVHGVFGWNATRDVALLSGAVSSSATSISVYAVTDPSRIGVGATLVIGTERVTVTGRSMSDTALDVGGSGVTASVADTLLPITGSETVAVGETILVGSERMIVTDVLPTALVVRRAVHGTTLSAHSPGAPIYAPWTLSVIRAELGTAGAPHSDGDVVSAWIPPSLIEQYVAAYAIASVSDMAGAYARPGGPGDASRSEITGAGVSSLRAQAVARYRRKGR